MVKIRLGFELLKTLYILFIYVTGYLRLGIMAKRSNKIKEAYKWYERALKVDSRHAVTLQLIRMLHLDINSGTNKFHSIQTKQVCTYEIVFRT